MPLAEARLTKSVKTGSRLLRKSVCKASWSRGDSRLLVALSVSRSAIATVKLHSVAGAPAAPLENMASTRGSDVLHDCAAAVWRLLLPLSLPGGIQGRQMPAWIFQEEITAASRPVRPRNHTSARDFPATSSITSCREPSSFSYRRRVPVVGMCALRATSS